MKTKASLLSSVRLTIHRGKAGNKVAMEENIELAIVPIVSKYVFYHNEENYIFRRC